MKKIFLIFAVVLLSLLTACSTKKGNEEEKTLAISEMARHADTGDIIHSQGILTERTGKRKFLVSDGKATVIIDLKNFKKQSKVLVKNDKVIFSGKCTKRAFHPTEIEVTLFKHVQNFK